MMHAIFLDTIMERLEMLWTPVSVMVRAKMVVHILDPPGVLHHRVTEKMLVSGLDRM
jgi:hypothetical protein